MPYLERPGNVRGNHVFDLFDEPRANCGVARFAERETREKSELVPVPAAPVEGCSTLRFRPPIDG
jgi:hypothetical protein